MRVVLSARNLLHSRHQHHSNYLSSALLWSHSSIKHNTIPGFGRIQASPFASICCGNNFVIDKRTVHKPHPANTIARISRSFSVAPVRIEGDCETDPATDDALPPWRSPDGVPMGYWKHSSNHRKFFEWTAKQLGVNQLSEWYRVTSDQVCKLGGAGLLANYYKSSLVRALTATYPEYDWIPWRFANGVPKGFWNDAANRRKFFDWAAQQLGINIASSTAEEDWYRVRREQIFELGGTGLLKNHFKGSLQAALSDAYPEVQWLPWRFEAGAPAGYWRDEANHKKFFDWASAKLGLNHWEDWYRITLGDVCKLGGTGLLTNYYGSSLPKALCSVYPEFAWLPWRFSGGVPDGYWSDSANQRKFFDWAAKQLAISGPTDDKWYQVTADEISRLGGSGLLAGCYNNSLSRALSHVYPESNWKPWRASTGTPRGTWDDPAIHREFFDWAAQKLGVTHCEDWYRVTRDEIHQLGGATLLAKHYDGSLWKALLGVYPDNEEINKLLPWRFSFGLPAGYWQDTAHHRRFFDWAAGQLAVTNHEDWYDVENQDIRRLGGAGLLSNYYQGSLQRALSTIYPEVQWQTWKFRISPISPNSTVGMATDGNNSKLHDELRQCIKYMEKKLDVRELDDWYRVSWDQIRQLRGHSIIAHFGGLFTVLKALFPNHAWDEQKFHNSRGKKSAQRWLKVILQKLFPNQVILEEYVHQSLSFQSELNESGIMTLDLWIPSLNLAFEYHGQQHFHDNFMFGDPSKLQARDAARVLACKQAGITLIIVPYWWDRTVESITATIYNARPDLVPKQQAQNKDAPPPISLGDKSYGY